MIKNKKGLSTIVTTLIIILLVLVAIGIVWVVVRGVIEEGTSEIDIKVKCIDVNVKATAVTNCAGDPALCDVILTRGAGGDAIGGAMLVFYEGTTATAVPHNEIGDISALGSTTALAVPTGLTTPDRIEVTAYFTDDQGNDQLCSQASTFSF